MYSKKSEEIVIQASRVEIRLEKLKSGANDVEKMNGITEGFNGFLAKAALM